MINNLISAKGNKVAYQYKIETKTALVFQSYKTVIAKIMKKGNIYLDPDWDCSSTTLKYLKVFLGISSSKKQIKADIKNGVYKVRTLN